MNRVRSKNGIFQVLITPHHRFDAGTEMILGNWSDSYLGGYNIINTRTMEDAMIVAYSLPDINWDQIVLWHKNIFSKLYGIIRYEIDVNDFSNFVSMRSQILNPMQLKMLMMDRVMIHGKRFRMGLHMNDLISYRITSMRTDTLQELSKIFFDNQALRITHSVNTGGVLRLIGKTDLSTHYEIILCTKLIEEWYNSDRKTNFKNILEQQQKIDSMQ